jgi:hypothetical protein
MRAAVRSALAIPFLLLTISCGQSAAPPARDGERSAASTATLS